MKALSFLASALTIIALAGCGEQRVEELDPILHSQHPDQVLLDRAIRSLENEKYAEASILLQDLIQAFPDSPLAPDVKSAMENCLRDRECAPIVMLGCGGLTFFPDIDSTDSPSEDLSPQERLNHCMEYKD